MALHIRQKHYINKNDESNLTHTLTQDNILTNSHNNASIWLQDKMNQVSIENSEVFECDIDNYEDITNYDPAMIPSDYNVAKVHERANEVGIPLNYNEVCPCCFQPCIKERINIFNDDQKLIRYGPGFSLYFILIKHSIFILLGVFLISSLYTWIITIDRCKALENNQLIDNTCAKIFSFRFLIHDFFPTQISEVEDIQAWLNFSVVIFLIITQIVSEQIIMRRYIQFTEMVPRISNYTILIQNLPVDLDIQLFKQSLIEKLRSEQFYGEDIHIRKILPIYRVGQYYTLIKKRHELKVQTRILETRLQRGTKINMAELQQKHHRLQDKIDSMEEKGGIDFSGKVFVLFENPETVQLVQTHHILSGLNRLYLMCGKNIDSYERMDYANRVLVFQKAPEPNDIIWQNFGMNFQLKIWLRLMQFFLTIIFMGLAIILFGGIYIFQQWLREDQNNQPFSIQTIDMDLLLSVLLSVIITCFVHLGRVSIKQIATYSKPNTYSDLYSQVLFNLLAFNLCCIIIVPFVFAFFVLQVNQDYDKKQQQIFENPLWLANIVVFVIYNCFSHITHRIFRPLMKFLLRKSIQIFNLYKFIQQQRLNKIFQQPEYSMAQFYANYNKIILFSLVYSQIIPIMPLIGLLALLLTYLSDKYYILRKYSEPKYVSVQLFQSNSDNFQYILTIFTIINTLDFLDMALSGKLTSQFSNKNANLWTAAVILTYVTTFFYFFAQSVGGIAEFISKNDHRHSYIHQDNLSQNEPHFPGDYERTYPFTKIKSNREYIKSYRKASQSLIQTKLDDLSNNSNSPLTKSSQNIQTN